MRERIEFYIVERKINKEFSWIYSASEFQKILDEVFLGKTLKKLFVGLGGYLDSSNMYFYSGDLLLLVFDDLVLELAIHVEGMMEYRIVPIGEIKIPKTPRKDYPPSDIYENDSYYFDLSDLFDLDFVENLVKRIKVVRTDSYAFSLSGFDETLADAACSISDLPKDIELLFENNVLLRLLGDEIEYFCVKIEEQK